MNGTAKQPLRNGRTIITIEKGLSHEEHHLCKMLDKLIFED